MSSYAKFEHTHTQKRFLCSWDFEISHWGRQQKNRFQSCINRLFWISHRENKQYTIFEQHNVFQKVSIPVWVGFHAVQGGEFQALTAVFYQPSGQHFPPCSWCIPWAPPTPSAALQDIRGIAQCYSEWIIWTAVICVFIFNLHVPQKIDLCVTTGCHQWELRESKRTVGNLEADRNNSQVKFVSVLMLAIILLLTPQVTRFIFHAHEGRVFCNPETLFFKENSWDIWLFLLLWAMQSMCVHIHTSTGCFPLGVGLSLSAASATTARELLLDFSTMRGVKWEYGELCSLNNLMKSAVHTPYF